MTPVRLLSFSTLYPNAAQPQHGVFIENRLRHLLADEDGFTARVVAPVPWFPFRSPRFGSYSVYARAPAAAVRYGVPIVHPRYPVIPKIGMTATPYLLYRATRPVLSQLRAEGYGFDVIDAAYLYPDGVAAALLARDFNVPLCVTALGSDVNVIPEYAAPRRMIQRLLECADAIVTVADDLKHKLESLGARPDKVTTVRNGVDLQTFRPLADRATARARMNLPPPGEGLVLAGVGNLVGLKRHHLTIEALRCLPSDTTVLLAGAGPEEGRLRALAARLGVADRVRFLGRVPHEQLVTVYGVADALVLASSHEGIANVLLESMACGTPVVASRICGTPEVVNVPEAGRLFDTADGGVIAECIQSLPLTAEFRAATRAHAERFGWDGTSRGLACVLRRVITRAKAA